MRVEFPGFRALFFSALATTLAACSPAADDRGSGLSAPSVRMFSAEDKKVAAALSLGAGPDLDKEGSPYAQAVACKAAYDDVAERLAQPGMVSADQMRSMETAGEVFQKRLSGVAASVRKSGDEIQRDLAARKDTGAGAEATMRILISCLRKLQDDARR